MDRERSQTMVVVVVGEEVKMAERRQSKDGEGQLFTDRRADTWPRSAGPWSPAKRNVSSRDGAACQNLSGASGVPGQRKAADHLFGDYH